MSAVLDVTTPPPGGDLLSTAAAAQRLGVAEGTLRYWRYVDQGPRSFRVGRHVKYLREDIDAFISSQLVATARGGN
jgi:predicted DNA-binding transcriptional regulator AlpA